MKTTQIKTRDGRIIKLVIDKIVAVDYVRGDNYISVTTVTGMYSIYFEDPEDIDHLDDIASSILTRGSVIMAKTVVFSK